MLHQPTGRKGRSPQRHKYPQECHRIVPSSSQPSPTIWGNQCGPDDRDCHTHTTSQNHCSQDCRDIIDPCNAPGPDIATVWTCPTPVYTHTEGDAQTTHRARAIVLCALRRPTCPQCNAIVQHQAGMQPQQRKHNGDQSTIWRGHTRPTTSPKEGKRRGYISKEFCANTDLCPLASPRVALVGVCLLRHPDKGNTR